MNKLGEVIRAIIVVTVALVGLSLLFAWPLSVLWNLCLVPAVSGLHEVGIIQMWGITVLFACLFKSSTTSK